MNIQVCRDASDAVVLYLPQRLYLKSFAKLNISVQLPAHKVHGKSISNWELMEKLRKMIQPDAFSMLKVSKHSSELIRFDAELEHPDKLERVLSRLEDRVVQLNDFPEPLKVKVSEAKSDFPSRHSWDSFFRDATDMDEMKPGERPDTIHISNLPIRWFVHERDRDADAPPSEHVLKKVFEKFGNIRQMDVPIADPFRLQMKATMRGITTPPSDQALYFEAYIQFHEYVSFVRCMDALRGRKLLRKKDDIAEWCGIKVDFDKTKHMTDAAVKRRAIVRERLSSRQRAKDDEEKAEKDKIAKREAKERQKYEKGEREKLEKMREREERRKKKQLAKLMQREDVDLNGKVAEERKKLLEAQKKLQAMRLIEELFKRIELRPDLQMNGRSAPGERAARARVVDRCKRRYEESLQSARDRFQQALDGRIVLRSALETKKPRRSLSASSASSSERPRRGVKVEKMTTPERELEYNKAASMFGMPHPYSFGYPFAAVPPPGYPFPQRIHLPAMELQNPIEVQSPHIEEEKFVPDFYVDESTELKDSISTHPTSEVLKASMYYPVRGQYYPPPDSYRRPRGRGGGWGGGGGGGGGGGRGGRGRGVRMPYFDGPDASHQYYKYFKRLTENEHRSEHDDRARTRSRSRSRRRSYSRSRSRTRSRSRRRSYTRSRSRSRSRRSRSRSRRRSKSRNRRSRSRSRRRSYTRSRSRARSHSSRSRSRRRSKSRSRPSRSKHSRSRSRSRKSRSRSRRRSKPHSPPKQTPNENAAPDRPRSKSWSLPRDGTGKEWSKSPKNTADKE